MENMLKGGAVLGIHVQRRDRKENAMTGVGTAELPVSLVVILLRWIVPIALVCAAAYFGARKGVERALRDKREDGE